ncbi:hypothetical protein C8N43_2137 [Litoreibacter ponti]|uniref:YcxB-like protein n=1 Tax=Litoreibacter ponti TaxID=1510457 RepID=A0A2T6BNA4_9RHOB|nr:hypothetical protein [Litoreibacter ponti]PTX57467.1 hypothetical protein C8N43_2137 [Litoreibacter ponti]
MSEEIVVKFRLGEADFAAAMREAGKQMHRRRSKMTFLLLMVGIAVATVVVLLIVERGFQFETDGSHFVAFVLGMVTCLCIIAVNARLALRDTAALGMAEDAARGQVTARFGAEGVHWESGVGHTWTRWNGISEVMAIPHATVLRTGAVLHPIPDAEVPIPGETFRTQLTTWKDAA